jgi:hypothetical protein
MLCASTTNAAHPVRFHTKVAPLIFYRGVSREAHFDTAVL